MAKNLETNIWACQIETGPDHAIKVNEKELPGLEEFLLKLSEEAGLNWWELGCILVYLGIGQIAAADEQANDNQAFIRLAANFINMHQAHVEALRKGYNVTTNSNTTIN